MNGDASISPSHVAPTPSQHASLRIVDVVVDALREAGVRRIYGMPGGGSNMLLIDTASSRGLDFVLAHHEPAAVFMAAGEAEITGVPGVVLATLGPGVAGSVNGLAHCKLDQVPLILLTDVADDDRFLHQRMDHGALVHGAVKSSETLIPESAGQQIRRALETALESPYGPVHLDISAGVASAQAATKIPAPRSVPRARARAQPAVETAVALLSRTPKPALLVGLEARDPETVRVLRQLVERLTIPVLTTYKAKGTLPEHHPLSCGLVTNGALEDRLLRHADALVTVGLDTVELMPGTWPWQLPTISIGHTAVGSAHIPTAVELEGDPAALLVELEAALLAAGWKSGWVGGNIPSAWSSSDEVTAHSMRGMTPGDVAVIARSLAPEGAVATVDAGSHMFPATLFWSAERPRRFLISNGLSTMGYSFPAAIGASLACPDDPVVCFIGDGGMAMVAGELETAARLQVRVVVLVFSDRSLNLIKIKQERRGQSTDGLDFGEIDWASVANGMGVSGVRVSDAERFSSALERALVHEGPTLIDVQIDPTSYPMMLDVIRG